MIANNVPLTIVAWLDAVYDGLGLHASIFTSYGAQTVADLADFDKDEIFKASKNFSAAGVLPLQIKKIAKALGDEAARTAAAREVTHRIPSSTSTATVRRYDSTLKTKENFWSSVRQQQLKPARQWRRAGGGGRGREQKRRVIYGKRRRRWRRCAAQQEAPCHAARPQPTGQKTYCHVSRCRRCGQGADAFVPGPKLVGGQLACLAARRTQKPPPPAAHFFFTGSAPAERLLFSTLRVNF